MNVPPDKPTLREQLDAVRPDSDDLRDPELGEAARAVETSELWQQTLDRQQAFDRQVAAAMQAVETPDGLQARLMESLAEARQAATGDDASLSATGDDASLSATGDDASLSDRDSQPVPGRGRTIRRLAAIAACVLLTVATAWLLYPRDGVQMTLEQTRQVVPTLADGSIDISHLPAFDGNFAVDVPNTWVQKTVSLSELKGIDWTGDDRHDGAIYEFQVDRRIHGYLLILQSTRLSDPPTSPPMNTSTIGYRPVPNTAWVNSTRKLAYICYVDQGDLQTLQRLLYPHAA